MLEKCYSMSVHCFSKGVLIKFDLLYFKQSSATRSKCLVLILEVTSPGPEWVLYQPVLESSH